MNCQSMLPAIECQLIEYTATHLKVVVLEIESTKIRPSGGVLSSVKMCARKRMR